MISRRFLRFLALASILSFETFAATAEPALRFPSLELTDGRKLKNVTVKSLDRATGKLLIIADGKATTLPLALVAPPVQARLAEHTPPSGSTVSTITLPPSPAAGSPGQAAGRTESDPVASVTRPPPAVIMPMVPQPSPATAGTPRPTHPITAAQQAAAQAGDSLVAHRATALKHAQSYYRFEFRLGSDAGAVTGLEVDLNTPQPVPGWTGRYRADGKAYLEFYDSRGRSFQRRTSTFDIVTEKKPADDDIRIVEFTPKS